MVVNNTQINYNKSIMTSYKINRSILKQRIYKTNI